MTSTAEEGNQVVARARGMRELVRAEAAESERLRTLTPAIVDEMWASGLMSSFNPMVAGGVEPSFAEMIETWIEMAWQDGSFGWIGIANLPSTFAAGAYLPDMQVAIAPRDDITFTDGWYVQGLKGTGLAHTSHRGGQPASWCSTPLDPRGQSAGARLPRPLHRHAARVHQ